MTALVMAGCFLLNTVLPVYALNDILPMPAPGTLTPLSAPRLPTLLKGMIVDPKEPLHFDVIVNPEKDLKVDEAGLRKEVLRLMKYFLASLTTPENDLWVNLSPVEKDRIIAPDFGKTEMGRDLLAQDYLLKQITASLLYPDSKTGKAFWEELYRKAYAKFGTTDIPVDTFNKVWITPDHANVYTNGNKAYIIESRLKVMLETDYLATQKDAITNAAKDDLAQNILREVVIPVLEKEVNTGTNFATLRQIYQALILSAWFKRKLKENALSKAYSDQNKNTGLEFTGMNEQAIYAQYIDAYKQGAFNFIREEKLPGENEPIPHKYFSGGVMADKAQLDKAISFTADAAGIIAENTEQTVSIDLMPVEGATAIDTLKEKILSTGSIGEDPKLGRIVRASFLKDALTDEEKLLFINGVDARQPKDNTSFWHRWANNDGVNAETFFLISPEGEVNGRCDVSRNPFQNTTYIHNVWTWPKKDGRGTFLITRVFRYLKNDQNIQRVSWDSVVESIGFYHKVLTQSGIDYETHNRGTEFSADLNTLGTLPQEAIKAQEEYFTRAQARTTLVQERIATMNKDGGIYQIRSSWDSGGSTTITVTPDQDWVLTEETGIHQYRRLNSLRDSETQEKVMLETIYGENAGIWRKSADNTWTEIIPPSSVGLKKSVASASPVIQETEPADYAMAGNSLKKILLAEEPIGTDPELGRVIPASRLIKGLNKDERSLFRQELDQKQKGYGTRFLANKSSGHEDLLESFLLINNDGEITGHCIVSEGSSDDNVYIGNVWTNPRRDGRGTFLLKTVLRHLNKNPDLQTADWDSNDESIDFYHQLLAPWIDYETRGRGHVFIAYLKTIDTISPEAIRSQEQFLADRKARSDIVNTTIAAMNTKGGTYEIRENRPFWNVPNTARIIVGSDHTWRLTHTTEQYAKPGYDDLKDDEVEEMIAFKAINAEGVGIWEQTADNTWAEFLAPSSARLKKRVTSTSPEDQKTKPADDAMADISLRRKLLLEPPIGKDLKLGSVIRASLLIGKLDSEEDLLLTEAIHQKQEGNGTSFQLREGYIDGDTFESFLLINTDGTVGGRCDISRDAIGGSIYIHNVWTSPRGDGRGTFMLNAIFQYLNKDPDIQQIEWDALIPSINFYHKFLVSRLDYETSELGKHFTVHLKTLGKLSPKESLAQKQYFSRIQQRTDLIKDALAQMEQKGGLYQLRKDPNVIGAAKTTARVMVKPDKTWLLTDPSIPLNKHGFDSLRDEKAKQKILFETVHGKSIGIWQQSQDRTWTEILPPGSVELKKRSQIPNKKIDAAETTPLLTINRTFKFLNPYHIHNRPSALLVMLGTELAQKLHVSVSIENTNDKAPITSMIGLLSMFITYSQDLKVSVEGKQSVEVRTAVLDLVEKAMQDWHMLEEETHNRPLFHAYLQEIDDIAKKSAATTSDDAAAPGGIDLDPRKMDLTETRVSSDVHTTSASSPDIFIDLTGLTPVIGAIYPVNDLKALLTQ